MTQQINWNYVPDSVAAENDASTEERIFFKEIEKVTQAHTNQRSRLRCGGLVS